MIMAAERVERDADPFLNRICRETMLCQDEDFCVVADAEPMTKGHYMLFCREPEPGLADCNLEALSRFLTKEFHQAVGNRPYLYFERGRASFCTSLNGAIHGHSHLVPSFRCEPGRLFPAAGEVECFQDVVSAYRAVPAEGQYLLWGEVGGSFYLAAPLLEVPKRMIRNAVAEGVERAW